jgi:hypothetical protein
MPHREDPAAMPFVHAAEAVGHAPGGAHETIGIAAGLIVWGVGALFVMAAIADRRGAFARYGVVAFRDWSAILAAGFSAVAAAIHFAVSIDHFSESLVYGIAFVATAWFQLGWALAYMVIRARPLAILAIAVNVTAVVAWAVSRTVGLPAIGVHEGPEAAGVLDLLASALEIGVVALLVVALASPLRRLRRPLQAMSAALYPGAILVAVLVATTVAFSLPDGGHGGGHSESPAGSHDSASPAASHDHASVPTPTPGAAASP